MIRRIVLVLLLFVLPVLVPPAPFERPLYLLHLMTAPAPDQLAVPVAGVPAQRLRSSWGGARSGGRTHQGIDIFAPRGTPVVSATEGMVWKIGLDRLGGQVVWVLGPGGQMHYYAHLDRYAASLREGDRVAPLDVLGTVGTTGNARGTPPHLHYGIYTKGAGAIDPFPLLVHNPHAAKRVSADHPS